MTIYYAVAAVLVLAIVGAILLVALGIFHFIEVISVRANEGQAYRYPLTIRFLK